MSSNSMEFAKGMAGISTGSAYNVVGSMFRDSQRSSDRQYGADHVGSRTSSADDLPEAISTVRESRREQTESRGYSGLVKNMRSGDIGWTVPWVITRDAHGDLYVPADCTLYDRPGGTAQMDVGKIGNVVFVNQEDIAA